MGAAGNDEVNRGKHFSGMSRLDRLTDELHRGLGRFQSESPQVPCWLLFDLAPLGLLESDDPELAALLTSHLLIKAKSANDEVPADLGLALLPVDPVTPRGSSAIRTSLEVALGELTWASLSHGRGRVVAAWLECHDDIENASSQLRRHFSDLMLVRRPDGRLDWLRWYDPAVLWVLWPCLGSEQQAALLGPIHRWWFLSPAGELQCLSVPIPQAADAGPCRTAAQRLGLTALQWDTIDAIGALNLALVEAKASEFDLDRLNQACRAGLEAIGRARVAGFGDRRDLALYAYRAIACHSEFDQHPIVVHALQSSKPGDYFSACVDDLSEGQWQQIRRDMQARRSPPLTSEQDPSQ